MSWPKDNIHDLIAFYGNPGLPGHPAPGWEEHNLVRINTPFAMFYDKHLLQGIRVHRLCADAFHAVFNDIWLACGMDQKRVNATGASDYAGVYNLRYISGTTRLSNHAFGCAIDLSPATNGFYTKGTTLDHIVIDAFKKQGARWGGDYHGRKDPMHFEFVSPA